MRIRCGWSPTATRATSLPVRYEIAEMLSSPLQETKQRRPSPLLVAQYGLWPPCDERVREGRAADDRGVVGHRPGHAQLACRAGFIASPWCAESSRYSSRRSFFASSLSGSCAIRSGRSRLQVVLDEAVQERELEVHVALVRAERHRPHGGAHVGPAVLRQLVAHVDPPQHLQRAARRRPRTSGRPSWRRTAGRRAASRRCRCWRGRSACRRARSCSRAAGRRTRSCRRSARVRVSITWTLRAVDADTSRRRPSGEIAMWSARLPSTCTRQTILRVRRLIATTSARLGRET